MAISLIPPKRFYSLDILRGIAVFRVILWHWQHFFLPLNKQGVIFFIDRQPLFEVFYIFYKSAAVAIPFFFCLSGFIFFWLYSTRIAQRTITLRSFSISRVSRLYPLHFVTLIFVSVGQFIYASITNTYFVYPFNDVYHFLLNLFLVSSWGLEKGWSFNAPIWLLSVEVILYAMFFIFCRIFYRNIIALFCMVIIGHFIVSMFNYYIATGIEYFFFGGIIFLAYEQIAKTGDAWKVSIWLPFITTFAWLATILFMNPNLHFTLNGWPRVIREIAAAWPVLVLLPLTIMSLALIETKRGSLGKRLSFVGDMSYSLYLLHFPLQLMAATVVIQLNINPVQFYSAWFMLSFFIALTLLSIASRRYFEIPIQRFLRSHL
jgi:peptidoglycan/LPS O-acetylase OafA/YrhL